MDEIAYATKKRGMLAWNYMLGREQYHLKSAKHRQRREREMCWR